MKTTVEAQPISTRLETLPIYHLAQTQALHPIGQDLRVSLKYRRMARKRVDGLPLPSCHCYNIQSMSVRWLQAWTSRDWK